MQTDEINKIKKAHLEILRAQIGETSCTPALGLEIGVPAIDKQGGGLLYGAIHEIVGSFASGSLLLEALLKHAHIAGSFLALIDAADSFDPTQWAPALLSRMLWIRCHSVREAIVSTDLLLRDENFSIVILDMQAINSVSVPRSTWYRFARIAETSKIIFVVLSLRPIAVGVKLRLIEESRWSFQSLQEPRNELISSLRFSMCQQSVLQQKRFA
ncbi:MAG: hypothetical protein C5B47_02165 [Verrucomicrobia bacterium]|nr:MAG: hypothetical protein C5B47_02165 [Verrucomicrobiota bacterium]